LGFAGKARFMIGVSRFEAEAPVANSSTAAGGPDAFDGARRDCIFRE